jgi:uncharacterized protein (DUF58 family)
MPEARLIDEAEFKAGLRHETEALSLAQRFPSLIVAARDLAATVMHGVHGRRRPGIGETFWQFRPFIAGEATNRIDWRRSARDDKLYAREREWEAAHTVLIWVDRSKSMRFCSNLALQPKADRALILGLAAADLLVRGGERVGLLGLTNALAVRNIIERFAEALIAQERAKPFASTDLPPVQRLARNTQVVLIGDFLSDPDEIAQLIAEMSGHGARGHLVMIADPVEESFPFSGHMELMDVQSDARLRLGQAQSFRDLYIERLATHREKIKAASRARGWSFLLHRTDRPASEALLTLRMQLEASSEAARGFAG